MTIKDVLDLLESIAPLQLQESYDNAGLLCGNNSWNVKGVLCSLDATEEIIQEAIDKGANLIVAHHPIIFKGLKKINGYNYVERCIIKAIKNDIAIYAIHTNLDNVIYQGVNQKIAQTIGLSQIKALIPKRSIQVAEQELLAGTGVVGLLPHPYTITDFLAKIKKEMNTACVRYAGAPSQPIQKVAICGGSGSSFLHAAKEQNCHAYLSADFKYHEFFDAENSILIADVGHYESEQFTIDLLFDIITNNFSNFAIRKTQLNTNPVKYF